MFKHDSAFRWRPGYIYYPAMFFTGMTVGAINEGGAASHVYGAKWEGSHTGAPVTKEISTFGFNGVLLDTATDMVCTDAPIPADLDPQKDIKARVVWCSGSTDVTDTVTWIAKYLALSPNVTALATPATALDTAIAAQDVPVATAYALCKTQWGVIKGGTISDLAEHWAWLVEMNAFDAGLSEDKFFLGLEISYTPRRLYGGDGMLKSADMPIRTLSKQYS